MPYKAGARLPGERSSRLGHLEVLKSELVNELVKNFQESPISMIKTKPNWEPIPVNGKPLTIVFGIDGSIQPIESETPPFKRLAFVKTALLRIDHFALSKIDKEYPHPFALRDILRDSALYHATVFPLRHVSVSGQNTYHAIRRIIFDSLKDKSLDGEPMETLKWIAYEKWDGKQKQLPLFECPHCEKTVATLPYDAETGKCPQCNGELFLTDMLGFHQEMAPDSAPDTIATAYMSIHEVLLLFTGIRYYWGKNKDVLTKCLFVKDGPLAIRAQYSKLVAPIRRFLSFARDQGYPVHIIGQEKSGRFYEHLELIGRNAPDGSIFIPGDKYIKEEIQQRPNTGAPYGKDTNYGAKVFVKLSNYHQMVLNIPTGEFTQNPKISHLIGASNIFATLPTILSQRFEGALLPVELAHGIASLSTYPSAQILTIFAEAGSV
ncbi:hypothetical protein HPY86_05645 [candidate division WOR-3 bacterium]|jgi:hypothetical protein|nr:hypothetical protein [candidate division WOR-3 bacterium]